MDVCGFLFSMLLVIREGRRGVSFGVFNIRGVFESFMCLYVNYVFLFKVIEGYNFFF